MFSNPPNGNEYSNSLSPHNPPGNLGFTFSNHSVDLAGMPATQRDSRSRGGGHLDQHNLMAKGASTYHLPYARSSSHPPVPNNHTGWFTDSPQVGGWQLANVTQRGSTGVNRFQSRLHRPSRPLSRFGSSNNSMPKSPSGPQPLSPITSPPQLPTALISQSPAPQITSNLLEAPPKDSRRGLRWEYWEHKIILNAFIGPDAPPGLFKVAMETPRRPNANAISWLYAAWHNLSAISFKGGRDIPTLVTQWWSLVDTCTEIINFAKRKGLDVYSPTFDDISALIDQIILRWQACDSPISRGRLKQVDIITWTHDSQNGWLAMMLKHMRENASLRTGDTTAPSDSHERNAYNVSTASGLPTDHVPPAQLPPSSTTSEPTWQDIMPATLQDARAQCLYAMAFERQARGLSELASSNLHENDMRMQFALHIVQSDAPEATRHIAESWIKSFSHVSGHPGDNLTHLMEHWRSKFGTVHGFASQEGTASVPPTEDLLELPEFEQFAASGGLN
ncbi:hypothetical protein CTheo_6845 [Ceratobasidium theobromae]|uniref:Uncharacterized protein n=1 Tax=Ceratobasidium theobromae TaxID=1582974 RepID=A0A5N5QE35_9AGAM|nr:hypothetical protein CTheo_6845 [Ceratobasidium theobromae]